VTPHRHRRAYRRSVGGCGPYAVGAKNMYQVSMNGTFFDSTASEDDQESVESGDGENGENFFVME
jgi:hypothetical protein